MSSFSPRYDDLVNYVIETPYAGYYQLTLRSEEEELANYLIFSDMASPSPVLFPIFDRVWGLGPEATKLWVNVRARGSTIRTKNGLASMVFELQSRCVLRSILEGVEGAEFSLEDAAQILRERSEVRERAEAVQSWRTRRCDT